MKTNDIQLSAPDYFQSNETIDINVKPSSVKLSSLTLEGQAKIARDQSGFKPFDPKSYEKILGRSDVNPTLDLEDLNEYRALQQSGWRLLGSSVGNMLTTFVGDAISAVGASLNFPRSAYHLISNIWDDNAAEKWNDIVNRGLGAALMEAGDELGKWGKEVMPIYKTKAAEAGLLGGGLRDATWWAEAGPTIGNVAAMLVPYAYLSGSTWSATSLRSVACSLLLCCDIPSIDPVMPFIFDVTSFILSPTELKVLFMFPLAFAKVLVNL